MSMAATSRHHCHESLGGTAGSKAMVPVGMYLLATQATDFLVSRFLFTFSFV
jgi:hypothetical protein